MFKKMFAMAVICAALFLVSGCVSNSGDGNQPSAFKPAGFNSTSSMQNILKQIERQVPEFECVGTSTGTPESTRANQSEGYVQAGYVLHGNPRYHPPGEFPRGNNLVPYLDMSVTITCFSSTLDAKKFIKMNLFGVVRSVSPKIVEKYKNGMLYSYSSGFGQIVCQKGSYIIEINPNSEGAKPLKMKVLDAILAEGAAVQ